MSLTTRVRPAPRRALSAALAAGVALSVGVGGVAVSTGFAAAARHGPVAPGEDRLSGSGRYVVVLAQPPAASYRGGVAGLARTAPGPGTHYDPSRTAAEAYTRWLRTRQARVAASVGAEGFYSYTTSLNGFAADLTGAQAGRLAHDDRVLAVVPDRVRRLDRVPEEAPAAAASSGARTGAGRGLVLGVVDSGVDSDHPAFATGAVRPPGSWSGRCQRGTDPDPDAAYACTGALIGGRYLVRGLGGPDVVAADDHLSPEDLLGHGTRVAAAAASVAPGARVASYKACWSAAAVRGGCTTSDTVAAVDRAVADGVDVLAVSVSGATSDPFDPVQLAFLHAADAGVFVAASAGDNGPAASSVAHPSPWATTVATATSPPLRATISLGNGQRYRGASTGTRDLSRTPLVLGYDVPAAGATPDDARRCLPGSLAPGLVDGAVVVCDRGTTARVRKGAVVARAGGVGMLLVNPTGGSVDADPHAVPTVHLPDTAYDGLYAYVDSAASATVRIRANGSDDRATAVAPSSGRGPSTAAGGDVLKPDLAAPGTGELAGHALRLMSARPDWSPMVVKSALMTTARPLGDDGSPFEHGAGLVRPRRALDPGLVLDSGLADWSSYLARLGPRRPVDADPARASNLNAASIAVGDLGGRETVVRTVTNVDDRTATYSVRKAGLAGISVVAFPSVFTLAPGAEQEVRLRLERDTAPLQRYETGLVRFTDSGGRHVVRLPVAVRPVGVRAPDELALGPDDATRVAVRPGVTGGLVARPRGLVAAVDTDAEGSDTGGVDFRPDLDGVWTQTLEVAGPAELVRIQAVPDDDADDLDLYLLDGAGSVVASAATRGAGQQLTTRGLAAGTYTVAVQPWFVAAPAGDTSFTIRTFRVPRGPVDGFTVDPRRQAVAQGGDVSWKVRTEGLDEERSYLGWVGWYAGRGTDDVPRRGPLGRTLVTVDRE